MERFIIVIILVVSFIILESFCFVGNSISNEAWSDDQPRFLQGVEILTGFGRGELTGKKDYHLVPIMIGFDFNLKLLTQKIGFNPPSLIQFQIEPFLSLVTNPDNNMEVGTSFLLKVGLLPEDWRFQPYVKSGLGMIYMSQHTLDQNTQFNFLINGGTGFHYFFKKQCALTLEYRFRHASNAGIKQPNGGIDTHSCLLGIAYLF